MITYSKQAFIRLLFFLSVCIIFPSISNAVNIDVIPVPEHGNFVQYHDPCLPGITVFDEISEDNLSIIFTIIVHDGTLDAILFFPKPETGGPYTGTEIHGKVSGAAYITINDVNTCPSIRVSVLWSPHEFVTANPTVGETRSGSIKVNYYVNPSCMTSISGAPYFVGKPITVNYTIVDGVYNGYQINSGRGCTVVETNDSKGSRGSLSITPVDLEQPNINVTILWTPYEKEPDPPDPPPDSTNTPVELSSFTCSVVSDNVLLQWITQSETQVSGYYLLRNESNDLSTAGIVSSLITATNLSQEASYSFTDEEVVPGIWYYWLENLNLDGSMEYHGPISVTLSAGDNPNAPITEVFPKLSNIYPNPFKQKSTISYELTKAEDTVIVIYNLKGEKVRTLESGFKETGLYNHSWNGRDDKNRACESGIYLLRMTAGEYYAARKLILIK